MATALIGSINPFDFNMKTWTSYQERLEQYFIVNGIKDEKKVAGLLTLLGEKSYGLLRSLTSPLKPSEKTYDELCALLKEHLSPKPLLIAERFRFHKRNQATGESINDYVATLRKLSELCDFGTNITDTAPFWRKVYIITAQVIPLGKILSYTLDIPTDRQVV